MCLLLALVTLATYAGVARNGFINFDDDRYVLTNSHVRAGVHWATIAWAFRSFDEANWHPLTWLSHALDCQLFQLNPAGHHNTSLLLHVANALLLFALLQRATKATGRSLCVASLFAVHPLNVESVAWVAERKSVLATLFFLLALGAYGWYARRPSVSRYLAVMATFALGLMAKPMVITLPFALLLADYWPLRRLKFASEAAVDVADQGTNRLPVEPGASFWRLGAEKLPLLGLSAASAIVTMLAQKAGGAVVSTAAHPPLLRLENAVCSYASYLGKTVWPVGLAVLYPYPHALAAWKVIGSALVLLAITLGVLRYRERRYLVAGWFWFLGTLVPMIGLVQVGNQALADRYAYLPLIGILVMAVWGAADRAKARRIGWKYPAIAGGAAVIALALVTRVQVAYWHDDLSLWSHTLGVTGDNFVAENNLGAILAWQGRDEEAVVHFRRASALEPGDPGSQINLGIYAHKHGDLTQAIARYERTLELAADTRIRAAAYGNLGQAYYAKGDYAKARENYEAALKLNNPYPLPLGLIAMKSGDWNKAAEYFAQELTASPSDVGFLLLAAALKHGGREQESRQAYQQAQRVTSDMVQARQIADKLLSP